MIHSGGTKLEEITYDDEIERTINQLIECIPEKIRQEVHDRLLVAFGIKMLTDFP